MKNRNVQIPYELFFQLLQYFLMENYESEEIIRQGLERKLDTMVNRELYSKYKTAPTEEEREKCRKVIDVFEELYEIEDEDILLVDVGRYGFVKLQCYTASHGFEELDTYTDSNSLFEGLWEEWLSLNVFLLAREMQLADVLYDDLFNNLPKEKQSELTGRKDYFAKKAGITL